MRRTANLRAVWSARLRTPTAAAARWLSRAGRWTARRPASCPSGTPPRARASMSRWRRPRSPPPRAGTRGQASRRKSRGPACRAKALPCFARGLCRSRTASQYPATAVIPPPFLGQCVFRANNYHALVTSQFESGIMPFNWHCFRIASLAVMLLCLAGIAGAE